MTNEDDPRPESRPLRLDPDAPTGTPGKPAFVARPAGTPVYHGFGLLEATQTEGWCYGMISEHVDPDGVDWGDGFVQAPDESRAGIAWSVGSYPLKQICEPSPDRWGAYAVSFPKAIRTLDDVIECFRGVLPDLQAVYEGLHPAPRRQWWPFGAQRPSGGTQLIEPTAPGPRHKRLCLIRLQHAVQRLALEAEEQVRQFPNYVVVADELALDFDLWRDVCRDNGYLHAECGAEQVESLVDHLEMMGNRDREELWTEEALNSSADWARLRGLAREALSAAKWPRIVPPTPREEGDEFIRVPT